MTRPEIVNMRFVFTITTRAVDHCFASYLLVLAAAFTLIELSRRGDASWVVSTPRSPVPAWLYLLAVQLKPSLPGLSAPERPLFTPSHLVRKRDDV